MAGTAIMHGQKKLSTFVAGRAQPVLGRERKTILQTYNPARPDFNMRQHIARCTLRPSLIVQALKVLARNAFRGGAVLLSRTF